MVSMATKRKLAAAVYRRPSEMVAMLNAHASLAQWLKTQDAPRFDDRLKMHSFVADRVGQQPIDYLEFGVFQGESFRHWLSCNKDPDSRFVGFDTFTGLPEDWGDYLGRGHFSTEGQTPQIDDARGSFRKGLFQETLEPFLESFTGGRQLVIHNDSDLYSSTLYTLAKLDYLIKPGTILIFDEFASPLHEYRAWNDYCGAFGREAKLIAYTDEFATQAAFEFTR